MDNKLVVALVRNPPFKCVLCMFAVQYGSECELCSTGEMEVKTIVGLGLMPNGVYYHVSSNAQR